MKSWIKGNATLKMYKYKLMNRGKIFYKIWSILWYKWLIQTSIEEKYTTSKQLNMNNSSIMVEKD